MTRVRIDRPIHNGGRIEFDDGSRYTVRNGYADMPDGKAALLRLANVGTRANLNTTRGKSTICACGFHAWAWSESCPRCGEPL